MNTKNSKTNELHRLTLKLTDKIDVKDPNKIMKLANLSIYYTWKYINSTYNNNKFKIFAPTLNYELNLPNGSYSISDIQDYLDYIVKKYETIAINQKQGCF